MELAHEEAWLEERRDTESERFLRGEICTCFSIWKNRKTVCGLDIWFTLTDTPNLRLIHYECFLENSKSTCYSE